MLDRVRKIKCLPSSTYVLEDLADHPIDVAVLALGAVLSVRAEVEAVVEADLLRDEVHQVDDEALVAVIRSVGVWPVLKREN